MSWRQRLVRGLIIWSLSMLLLMFITPVHKTYEQISYYSFLAGLKDKTVAQVQYDSDNNMAIIRLKESDKEYQLNIVSKDNFETDVYDYSLFEKDFVYSKYKAPAALTYIETIWVVILFDFTLIFVWNRIYRKAVLNKKVNFKEYKDSKDGKNKKERKENKKPLFASSSYGLLGGFHPRIVENTGITFKDVIGLDKQMDELQDIVRFLKEPEKYEQIGAALPKGILLFGQPGVGKTHIARAIAGEAGVPFYEISASELNAKYLGESEERIRTIFNTAEENAPAIIYIDEIDSVATKRYSENSNKYAASILNQLLACMDGFSKESNVIVIAATNHLDMLDDAILRSGRFDRKIFIHTPDKDARRKLIEYYSRDKAVSEDVNIERLVDITAGHTGADIKTILNEAALLSVRKEEANISEESIMEAYRKVEIGSENNFNHKSKEQLKRTAIHEAGHAIVSKFFGQNVSEVSIISRGSAAGYNLSPGDEDSEYGFNEMKHRIMVLLAGRAAEEEIFNEVSAGASNDLERASTIVRDMFLRYSMRDKLGVSMVLTDDVDLNGVIVDESYDEMNKFLKTCYEETKRILVSKRSLLRKLSRELVNKETLSKYEIEKILES